MKRILIACLSFFLLVSVNIKAQDEENKKKIEIGGIVKFQTWYDTHRSVEARDGNWLFYPLAGDNDYNKKGKIGGSAAFSRIRAKFSGGESFGAQISGVIEGDFCAVSNADLLELRLRHAFIQMAWESSNLTVGQTWHPIIDTDVIPAGLLIANFPFWPLIRSPQIKIDYKLSSELTLTGSALIHNYHKSKGPAMAQRSAGLPEFAGKLKYKNENVVFGVNGGILFLQPRDTTNLGAITSKKAVTKYGGGFFRLKTSAITVKAQAIYGENLTHFAMIGGFGAKDITVDDYDYSALRTFSTWADISTSGDLQFGLMTGYSANLGASKDYTSLGYGRSETLASVYRVAPRVVFVSNKFQIGFEYSLTGAVYGTVFDNKGKATTTDDAVYNNRFMLSFAYSF
jgi:hypothetical protein